MKKNSRSKYSFYNILFSMIYSLVSLIVGFVIQTLIIKYLSIEYVGIKSIFSNILGIITIVELDISFIFIYYLYKPISDNDEVKINKVINYFRKIYKIIFLIILILSIIFLPFIKVFIYDSTVKENIYLLFIIYVLNTIIPIYLSYKKTILCAYQQEYISLIIQTLYQIFKLILCSLLIFMTHNYYFIAVISLLLQTIEYLMISIIVNKKFKFIKYTNDSNISSKEKDKIKKDIYSIFYHKVSSVIVNNTDSILISLFYGIKTVSICSNYFMIIENIKLIFNKVIRTISPSVGNFMCSNGDSSRNYDIFKRIHFLNLWVAIYISSIILSCINIFIGKWIGDDYILNSFVVIIFAFNYFQSQMRACYMVFKDAACIYKEDRFLALLEAFINIIVSIILGYMIGLSGIIIGTIISNLVLWIYTYRVLIFKKLFKVDNKKYILNLLKSVLLLLLVLFLNRIFILLLNINDNLLLNLILSIIVSTIVMILSDYKDKNIKYYFDFIKRLK